MNKLLTITLFCFCCCCMGQNTGNAVYKQLQSEYLSVNKLSEFEFIVAKGNGMYVLSFREDSLPYFAVEDSLFKINVDDKMFILYYNCNCYKNTGFIIYGTYKSRVIHIIQTSKILSVEAHIINQMLLLKTVEDQHLFAFDNPMVLNTNLLLFSLTNHSFQKNVSVLSNASVLEDTLKIQLQVDLFEDTLFVKGTMDNKQIACVIKIEGDDLIVPKQEENLQWNSLNVFKKNIIYPKTIHIVSTPSRPSCG